MAGDRRVRLGQTGEDLAVEALRARGYAILDRRYRTRSGEIDIVARDGSTIVFVEVKTRESGRFGSPLEAITGWKRRKLSGLAIEYLSRRRLTDCPCRFDVVAVYEAEGRQTIEVVQGAFDGRW